MTVQPSCIPLNYTGISFLVDQLEAKSAKASEDQKSEENEPQNQETETETSDVTTPRTAFHRETDIDTKMTLYDLIRRIAKYTSMPQAVFVVGILYIDRYLTSQTHPAELTENNVQLVTLTAMMLAQKFYVDNPLDNKSWAWIGNTPIRTVNACEVLFLTTCSFQLIVAPDKHRKYSHALERVIRKRQSPRKKETKEDKEKEPVAHKAKD